MRPLGAIDAPPARASPPGLARRGALRPSRVSRVSPCSLSSRAAGARERAREISLARRGDDAAGSAGGPGGPGGPGGGGNGGENTPGDGNDGNDDAPRRGGVALGSLALAAFALATPPAACASASAAASSKTTAGDMGVCFLYGFTWFYGIKLALKHLFSPVLFFLGTMLVLSRMGAMPENLVGNAFESYVAPLMPRELTDKNLETGDRVKSAERKFWAFVHRTLPACKDPVAEKAFFAGILLAGLV